MVLPVVSAELAVAEQAVAAPIDEVTGLLGAEGVDDEVRHPASQLQEPGVAGGPMQSDGGLDEMPGAVQLVSPLELKEPFTRKPDLEVGVQVAVRLLRGTELLLGLGQLVPQPVGC